MIDYECLQNEQVLKRVKQDTDSETTMAFPTIFGSYILSQSRRIMNNFIHTIDGFNNFKVWYTDTDSLYIDIDSYKTLQQLGHVGSELGQGSNDYDENVITYGLFLGPKQKYVQFLDGSDEFSFKGIDKGKESKKLLNKQLFIDLKLLQEGSEDGVQHHITVDRWK